MTIRYQIAEGMSSAQSAAYANELRGLGWATTRVRSGFTWAVKAYIEQEERGVRRVPPGGPTKRQEALRLAMEKADQPLTQE